MTTQLDKRAEWEAEEELEDQLARTHYDFEDRLKREMALRGKYEAAMAEKRSKLLAKAGLTIWLSTPRK
jgi:hypothetical protein